MATIRTYKNKGITKPSVAVERNKTKRPTRSTILTRGLPLKHKRDCKAKILCVDEREKYGNFLFPVCPALKKWVNEEKLSDMVNIQRTNSTTLDSIIKIISVFECIIKTTNTKGIAWCAHRKNILEECLSFIEQDLSLLPKRLEISRPDTSKECKELIAQLQIDRIRYTFHHPQNLLYLMPPLDALKHYHLILEWRQQQMVIAKTIGLKPIEMNRLTSPYPAEAVKTMDKIYQELKPLEDILSEKPTDTTPKIEPQEKGGQMKTKKQTRKDSIPKTEKKIKQHPFKPEHKCGPACEGIERHKGIPAKIIKSTPQNMADGFKSRAKIITEKVNTFAYQQDDPELKRLYITYRLSIEGKVRSAKKYLNIDLPGPPKLIGDDYFGGMIHLADWCRDCAAILRGKINDTEPNPELLMCFDELELHFDKDKRTIRRLAQKYNLSEYPDSENRNRIRIYLPDFEKIPEHDRLKTRDYESKQKLLAKRKQKQAKKK